MKMTRFARAFHLCNVLFFSFFLFQLFFQSSAWALPTRILWIPTTSLLEKDFIQVDVENRMAFDKRPTDPLTRTTASAVGASYGWLQIGEVTSEVGMDWVEPQNKELVAVLQGHFRVRLFDVKKRGWAVALGAQSVGFKPEVSDENIIYVNLENRIFEEWTMGAGAYAGSAKLLLDENGKEDSKGFFWGLWRDVQSGRGKAGVEWMSGKNKYSYLFAGAQFEIQEFVHGTLGYGFAMERETRRDWLLVRLSLDF